MILAQGARCPGFNFQNGPFAMSYPHQMDSHGSMLDSIWTRHCCATRRWDFSNVQNSESILICRWIWIHHGQLNLSSQLPVSISRSTHIFLQSAASQSKKTVTTVTLSIVQRRKDSLQIACKGSTNCIQVWSDDCLCRVSSYICANEYSWTIFDYDWSCTVTSTNTLPCKLLLHQCDASRVVTPLPAAARQWRHQRQAPVSTLQISECCALHDQLPKGPHTNLPGYHVFRRVSVHLTWSTGLPCFNQPRIRDTMATWPLANLTCRTSAVQLTKSTRWKPSNLKIWSWTSPFSNDFVQDPHEKRTNSQ